MGAPVTPFWKPQAEKILERAEFIIAKCGAYPDTAKGFFLELADLDIVAEGLTRQEARKEVPGLAPWRARRAVWNAMALVETLMPQEPPPAA